MVGRGGYGNPWIVTQALDLLAGRVPNDPTPEQRYAVAKEHFRLSLEMFGPQKSLGLMRKHLCWYARGMEGAASFRAGINQTRTIDEMKANLEEFFANAA
jgi:tRNA-dihydrouridine synthase